ncbi:MAG: hypothetical protein RIC56_09730 [Pseudomonadales bacterium]
MTGIDKARRPIAVLFGVCALLLWSASAPAGQAEAGDAEAGEAVDGAPGHVRGIGGVFFKVDDPKAVAAWYRRNFGLDVGDGGFAHFLWRDPVDPSIEQRTVWSPFPRSSDYFGDAGQQLMINYIVVDLDGFLRQLAANGVTQVGGIEEYDYGRFAWVVDVEGNRVELWEPPGPVAD